MSAADGTVKYSRDKMGRVLTLERKDASTGGFTYDPWGYLTSIIPPGAEPYTMHYDERGNMTFMDTPNATRSEYEYDLDHRPIKTTSADGRAVTISYDDSNRIKKIVSDGSKYEYTYFMTGQIEKIEGADANLAYTWDWPLLKTQTYKVNSAIGGREGPLGDGTRINVPDYMIRNGKTYYFILDHLGSVRAVVDVASGVAEQEIDYDTFGRVLSDSNPGYQPFGYKVNPPLAEEKVDLPPFS